MITNKIHMSGENMGIYKRKNSNTWQMCFCVNGKKVRKSTKTTSKKLANKIYEKAKAEALEGKLVINEKSKMPFDQLVHEFLEKHSKVEKESYANDISVGKRVTAYFKQTPIGKIKPYDIKSWRHWRMQQKSQRRGTPVSKSTLNVELSFLKMMFSLAVEWEWLAENPARPIKKLKGETQRMRFLNWEDINRLIDCAAPFLKPVIITAVSTGMRRGEIINLKWKDVDFVHRFIRVEKTKNKEPRDIPIDGLLMESLESLKESQEKGGYVFLRKNGARVTDSSVQRKFRAAVERAGIEDFRFHDLRHTAASLFASGGCDIMSLKNLLGHKTIEMTQRYAHLMPDSHEKTRRIMCTFWKSASDTKTNTGHFAKNDFSPERPDNPLF